MRPVDIALQYMDIFYSGRDLERLFEILSDDLRFEGPLYKFDSSREYIESLISDPPDECSYELRHTFEDGPFVNLIYTFRKPGLSTPMSQYFEVRDGKILRIELIFDTAQFF